MLQFILSLPAAKMNLQFAHGEWISSPWQTYLCFSSEGQSRLPCSLVGQIRYVCFCTLVPPHGQPLFISDGSSLKGHLSFSSFSAKLCSRVRCL